MATNPSFASISDMDSISFLGSEVGSFKDSNTGKIWLDLNTFRGVSAVFSNESFNSWQAKLSGTGFHIATSADMSDLFDSAPAEPALWESHSLIMGSPSSSRILGMYDDGSNKNTCPLAWKWSNDSDWGLAHSLYSKDARDKFAIWTVSDSPVPTPIPAALYLFITGIVGISSLIRKKSLIQHY